ncbi:MAG: HAD family hydrolase [Proteocatella sp.]
MDAKNIIFDYDGTLHESIKIYAPAFKKAYAYLVENGYAQDKTWSESEISRWLGYSSKDMWQEFMPELPSEIKEICSSLIGSTMLEYMQEGKAKLYEGSLETLENLRNMGYQLIFLSNCKVEYMQMHIRLFNLDKYFSAFYCTQQYDFAPKHEIFNHIRQNHPGSFIVVGDRFQDIEIAAVHSLFSIGCAYGYGSIEELWDADVIIQSIDEITDMMKCD